jgi:hypothetical protein
MRRLDSQQASHQVPQQNNWARIIQTTLHPRVCLRTEQANMNIPRSQVTSYPIRRTQSSGKLRIAPCIRMISTFSCLHSTLNAKIGLLVCVCILVMYEQRWSVETTFVGTKVQGPHDKKILLSKCLVRTLTHTSY